jgi:hypothetical protein
MFGVTFAIGLAVAIVVIGCVGMYVFRRPLTALIDRSKVTYDKSGLALTGTAASQTEKEITAGLNEPGTPNRGTDEKRRLESIKNFGISSIVTQQQKAIRTDLESLSVRPEALRVIRIG